MFLISKQQNVLSISVHVAILVALLVFLNVLIILFASYCVLSCYKVLPVWLTIILLLILFIPRVGFVAGLLYIYYFQVLNPCE